MLAIIYLESTICQPCYKWETCILLLVVNYTVSWGEIQEFWKMMEYGAICSIDETISSLYKFSKSLFEPIFADMPRNKILIDWESVLENGTFAAYFIH